MSHVMDITTSNPVLYKELMRSFGLSRQYQRLKAEVKETEGCDEQANMKLASYEAKMRLRALSFMCRLAKCLNKNAMMCWTMAASIVA